MVRVVVELGDEVMDLLSQVARSRNASVEELLGRAVAEWVVDAWCEDRCRLLDGVTWLDCYNECVEEMTKRVRSRTSS